MQKLKNSLLNNSWQQDFRNQLRSIEDINHYFNLKLQTDFSYSINIPLSFAKKIKRAGINSPLWKQFIPSNLEENQSLGFLDPIGDKKKSIGNGIIHRYKNRVLFTPTTVCPIICRYCFRKNELSSQDDIFKQNLEELTQYLNKNESIDEVILTGGDPLILSNEKLFKIFKKLAEQTKIKFLRVHTRTPIILPNRIDEEFLEIIDIFSRKFVKMNIVIHTNHEDELDKEVQNSLEKLSRLPIGLLSQSVLMKGINDTTKDLKNLFLKIVESKMTPYYLHHPDMAKGAMHFYLSLEEGRRIFAPLHDQLPGWAIAKYIVDNPQGHGKQNAFNPEKIEFSGKMLDKNGNLVDF